MSLCDEDTTAHVAVRLLEAHTVVREFKHRHLIRKQLTPEDKFTQARCKIALAVHPIKRKMK